MQKIFLILISASLTLFAYSDYDMDGVEDGVDKCPNTLLTDLVDVNGCTIKSLVSSNQFDVVFGITQAKMDSAPNSDTVTISKALQLDYYNKNFSLQFATSYFDSAGDGFTDSGINDTTVSISYSIPVSNLLSLQLSSGVILPTFDSDLNNNNSDYFASINIGYNIDKYSLFAGYSHTIINDDDDIANSIFYQDTNAYSAGVGYNFSSKLYANVSYFIADSVYKGVEDIQSVSAYIFYSINETWFTTFSHSIGQSDTASKETTSLKVGYYF